MANEKFQVKPNLQRWLVSYADFITLLFAFFVVMYAISSVNDDKYNMLTEVFEKTFKRPVSSISTLNSKELDNLIEKTNHSIGHNDFFENYKNINNQQTEIPLDILRRKIDIDFRTFLKKGLLDVRLQEDWLEVEIESKFLFNSGSAILTSDSEKLIKAIASSFKSFSNAITVEGFTDDIPINTEIFPSNWELSAQRSASVVRLLIDEGISPKRLRVVGYGDNFAIASNKTETGRNKNRRVILVIEKNDSRRIHLKQDEYYQNKSRDIFFNVDKNLNVDRNLNEDEKQKIIENKNNEDDFSKGNSRDNAEKNIIITNDAIKELTNIHDDNVVKDVKNVKKVDNNQNLNNGGNTVNRQITGIERKDGSIIYNSSVIQNK